MPSGRRAGSIRIVWKPVRSRTTRPSVRSVSMSTVISVALPSKLSSRKLKSSAVSESLGKKSLTAKVVLRLLAATMARTVTTIAAVRTGTGRRTTAVATRGRMAAAPGTVSATGLVAGSRPLVARRRSSTNRTAGTKLVITIQPETTPILAMIPKSAMGSNRLVRLASRLTAVVPAASRIGAPQSLTERAIARPEASSPRSSSIRRASR